MNIEIEDGIKGYEKEYEGITYKTDYF